MTDRPALVVGVVALVLAGAFGLAVSLDDGPPEPSAGSDVTPVPSSTTGVSGDAADSTTGTTRPPPFGFVITETEPCGQTCRDVTVALTNNRASTATNVTVSTRIFAGNETADGSRVWEGQEAVGTLAAGETVTSTRRVELGFGGALAVRNNDGWVTIETTVSSEEETTTFTRTDQVG